MFWTGSCGLALHAQHGTWLRTLADSLASQRLQETGELGCVIGVISGAEKYLWFYGVKDPGTRERPDSSSVFEIGPLSSTLTDVTFATMVRKGVISCDEPLQKYLPVDVPSPVYRQIVCKPVESSLDSESHDRNSRTNSPGFVCLPDTSGKPQPILMCYLATHTSGLPSRPYNLKISPGNHGLYDGYTRNDLYEFLKNYRLVSPIGLDYIYSDLGTAILGHAMSLKERMPFERVVENYLLTPVGMYQTGIRLEGDLYYRLMNGYNATGKLQAHGKPEIFAPATGFYSTPADMMRFLSANLGIHDTAITDMLEFSQKPRIQAGGGLLIALGWKVENTGKNATEITWNGGSTDGFSSFLGFCKSTKTGVLILSNCSSSVERMGKTLIEWMQSEN